MSDATRIARSLGWAKTYDAEYLALATVLGASLLTADSGFAQRALGRVSVVTPSDVTPPS